MIFVSPYDEGHRGFKINTRDDRIIIDTNSLSRNLNIFQHGAYFCF